MVRTDSVSRTVAVFVISHKNNLFSEIILKNGPSRWLLKWGGKIFWENTLTKPHLCRDRWRGNISRCFVEFYKNQLFPETCKKTTCFVGSTYEGICAGFMKLRKHWETPFILPILDAYHLRGILGSFHENEKSFGKHAKSACFDAYHMRGIHDSKNIFFKTPSQNYVFPAISEGVLSLSNVPW